MREQDRRILAKSIVVGSFVGLVAPALLSLVLWIRFGAPANGEQFLNILLVFSLFSALPSFLSACVGGCSALFFKENTVAPHVLVVGIVFAFYLGIVYYFGIEDGLLFVIILLAVNAWVCGWWSVGEIRLGRNLAIQRLAAFPPGYQDHFADNRQPDDLGSLHVRGSLQGFSDEPGNDRTDAESV